MDLDFVKLTYIKVLIQVIQKLYRQNVHTDTQTHCHEWKRYLTTNASRMNLDPFFC